MLSAFGVEHGEITKALTPQNSAGQVQPKPFPDPKRRLGQQNKQAPGLKPLTPPTGPTQPKPPQAGTSSSHMSSMRPRPSTPSMGGR